MFDVEDEAGETYGVQISPDDPRRLQVATPDESRCFLRKSILHSHSSKLVSYASRGAAGIDGTYCLKCEIRCARNCHSLYSTRVDDRIVVALIAATSGK